MTSGSHFAPLRDTNFRWFFLGDIVNSAGSSMSGIALPFAVLSIDNSATALGVVVAAWTVPMVAFMLLGGAVADRLPRALVLRACSLLLGVVQAVSATLVLTGRAEVWELAVLQFLNGTVFSVAYPAFHGMVPILLPEEERKSAYLLISQSEGLASILSPAVAGLLVATVGAGWGLAADAASFGVAAGSLTLLRLPRGERPERQASVVGDFRAGWSYARALGWVIPVACCSLVFNAMISGGLSVLGPVIAKGSIGSGGYGLARSGTAIGSLVATVALTRLAIRRPLRACVLGFTVAAVPMLVLGLGVTTAGLAAAFLVFGAGMSVISLAWSLCVQQKVREDMLSRIMAIDGFFSFVAMPLGELLVGPLAAAFGARDVEVGFAVMCGLVCLAGVTRPAIRDLRLEPVVESAPATP